MTIKVSPPIPPQVQDKDQARFNRELAAALRRLTTKQGAAESTVDGITAVTNPKVLASVKMGGNSTSSLATDAARCVFVGEVPAGLAAGAVVTVCWGVSTAGSGFSWGEVALAYGDPTPGANMTITPVGAVSASGQMAIVNPQQTEVTLTKAVPAGAGLWVVFAKSSTGSPTLRANGAADVTQAGIQGTNTTAGWRPSLHIGTATSFALDGTSTLAIQAVAVL